MQVLIDVGTAVQEFDIVATKAGRRVEVTSGRGMIEIAEVTRSGQPVRSARFMATRVVAIVEHPADDGGPDTTSGGRGRKQPSPGQSALLD